MLARISLIVLVLAVCMSMAGAPVLAQEKEALDNLQAQMLDLLKKVEKGTVSIHCKAKTERPTRPTIPGRNRQPRGGGSYYGSGAIISSDGYILTSTSVVPPKGEDIKVYMGKGKCYEAKLIGYEERNNVSLIKIEASGLPVLKLGSSKNVRTGQLAFTLGAPHQSILRDRQVAFSMGVISGIYRLRGDGDYTGRVIETDAALNDGSDGGPLVNAKGEVIGVLNLSYSYSKWLNVAVPVDQIKLIMKDLKEGSQIYPHYGMTPAEETEPDGGVALSQVKRRGPAYKAGLNRGDVILEVDGLKIDRPEQLSREMAILPPGSEMSLLVRRGDSELVVKLTSGKQVIKQEKPEPEPVTQTETKERGTMGAKITVENDGLVIEDIVKDGAADEAGLKPGDKIIEANGKKVKTIEDLQAIFKDLYAGDKLEILAERDGWTKKITLTLKKK